MPYLLRSWKWKVPVFLDRVLEGYLGLPILRVFSEKSHCIPVVFSLLPEVPKHYHLSNGLDSRDSQDFRSAATTASKLLKPELLLSIVCFHQLQERKVDIKYRRIAPSRFRPSNDLLPRSPSISPPPPARHSSCFQVSNLAK